MPERPAASEQAGDGDGERRRSSDPARRASGARGLQRAEDGCGPSIDVPAPRKVARRRDRMRSRPSAGRGTRRAGYRTMPRSGRPLRRHPDVAPIAPDRSPPASPEGARAPDPSVPRPPLRARRRRRPRGGRRAAVRRHRAGGSRPPARPAPERTSSGSTCRPTSPATSRRSLPARGADARRVALRRDAPQGPATGDLRLRADVPRPGHGRRADAARVLRAGSGSSRSGRAPASCRTSGRSRRRARTATGCSGRPA